MSFRLLSTQLERRRQQMAEAEKAAIPDYLADGDPAYLMTKCAMSQCRGEVWLVHLDPTIGRADGKLFDPTYEKSIILARSRHYHIHI